MRPSIRILLTLFLAMAALAAPARAQDNSYTVPGVHVAPAAAPASEALNAPINQGRSKAFQILYRRLTRQADWTRQPALDAAALLRLGRGFSIPNERRSHTRCV